MRSRLNVLMFPAWYPSPARPFLATFHREHARATALYHDLVVLDAPREHTDGVRGRQVEEVVEDGIRIVRLRYGRAPVPKTTMVRYISAVIATYRALVRSGFTPDVIHGHLYFIALPAVILGRLFRVPVVITENAECFATGLSRADRLEARLALGLADRVLPVSRSLRVLMEAQGVRARYEEIPNAVDTKVFYPDAVAAARGEGPYRLLTVARMMPVKGVANLLRSLAVLRRLRTDFTLDIVGDGDHRAEYEALAASLGLGGHVRFLGFQSREAVADHMRAAHVFVLGSLTENCPCVLLEAMASGLPIVATDVGGVREFVPEHMGAFAPRENPEALARTIAAMLDRLASLDPAEMAAYARSRFSLEAVGAQVDRVYQALLSERHRPRYA